MATHAYALKESVDPEGFDAAVGIGNGESLHISALIAEGNGVYVTDNPQEQEVLDSHASIKRVSLDDAEDAHRRGRAGGAAKGRVADAKDKD